MDLKRLDTDDLEIILGTLRDFAQRETPFATRLEWDRKDVCPEHIVRALMGPEVGLHLTFIPAQYDGMGGGAYDVYRLCTEFAKIDVGLATAMLAVALGTDPIRVGCTHEQKLNWMCRIANEGLVVAYGVTEPEAGSNVEALKTKAERITDESGRITHYKLNGVKQFISNGAIADLITVLAKAPDGPTFFVVEKGTQGLSPGKQEEKHGIRLSNTSQVVLEDVVVPAANIVGTKEGEGIKQSNEVFGFTRLMVAAFGYGVGKGALEKAVAYSKERKQFGTTLSVKQGYTHKLIVPNAMRLAAAKAYIEYTADLLDAGDGVDRQVEGSIAKLFATEAGNRAAEDAIQAHGGYGYCAEYEVEKMKRDARILTIYEGTSEIQQNIIGVNRMRQNVKAKGGFYNGLAEGVCALEHVGGAAIAKAMFFLSEATVLAFRARLTRNQHGLMEMALAMVEGETAVALARAADRSKDPLEQALSRLWAAEIATSIPSRMVRLFASADVLKPEELDELIQKAD
ncbi:MAG: acyl-CoA dehydrogenase family protein, partial [Myxococcota bacterium]|nr:acyl-CoA dehydrogenase family protein [Myxococcota bacterium]